MKWIWCMALAFASCKTTTFYVVRHAEKEIPDATMTTDVPLSEKGAQRAAALREVLKEKGIGAIYATPTHRTTSTARPLSQATGVAIQLYDARDAQFIKNLKQHRGTPVLVVGHSNTVDDVVNALTNEKVLQDLPETQYGDLFIVNIKGKKATFAKSRYGEK